MVSKPGYDPIKRLITMASGPFLSFTDLRSWVGQYSLRPPVLTMGDSSHLVVGISGFSGFPQWSSHIMDF